MQMCSVRKIVASLDMPVSKVHKILRSILHCYPYKITYVQELFPADLPVRRTFTLEILSGMEVENKWLWNILWLDDGHYYLQDVVNT